MQQILFPTAYASHSNAAFRYAQKLAQYFEAGITLVHIYESAGSLQPSQASLTNDGKLQSLQLLENKRWDEEMKKLKAFANELNNKQFQDIPLDFIVTDGEAVDELLQVQNRNKFDLVVMGMSRHNLIDRLFGNTAYSIIDNMACPVLLIPPGAHYMGMDKIVYGTAFQFSDMIAIDFLLEWSKAFKAKLDLLHVYKEENKQEAIRKMKEIMKHYKEENESGVIDLKLSEGKIVDVISKYIDSSSADLLAIHRRKQGFWQRITEGSLTKLLAEDIKIPLLVLKSL